eukprot:c20023_g1_i4.p1 GENE.c20023_g1_i4~~c20023_g1_i4.p1  ORF type:complete len:805 (+),score=184.06 c20023_g1_i4:202-2415(+)
MTVAVKQMSTVSMSAGRNTLAEMYREVSVMERLRGDDRVCHLFDYGVTKEFFWMVMRHYPISLRGWRTTEMQMGSPLWKSISLYLNVFDQVLESVQMLHSAEVVHYDIKCDNFLLSPIGGSIITPLSSSVADKDDIWKFTPRSDKPPFKVCACDFGTAVMWSHSTIASEREARGTECIRGPELIMSHAAGLCAEEREYPHPRFIPTAASPPHTVGVPGGCAEMTDQLRVELATERVVWERRCDAWRQAKQSDVWSLGCLLYELITSDYLFVDEGNNFQFIRVAREDQTLLDPVKMKPLECSPTLVSFLAFVLNRDHTQRPTLEQVAQRFRQDRHQIEAEVTKSNMAALAPPRSHNTDAAITSQLKRSVPRLKTTVFEYSSSPETSPRVSPRSLRRRPCSVVLNALQRDSTFLQTTVSRISRHVYLAGLGSVLQHEALSQYNITHAINCCDTTIALDGLEVMRLGNTQHIISRAANIMEFIQIASVSGGRVLVFDEGEAGRACLVVLLWLVYQFDILPLEAILYVARCRPTLNPDPEMITKLTKWSQGLSTLAPKLAPLRMEDTNDVQGSASGPRHRPAVSRVPTSVFQCLCGAVCVGIQSFTAKRSEASVVLPMHQEDQIKAALAKTYGYKLKELEWRLSSVSQLSGDFTRTVALEPVTSEVGPSEVERKGTMLEPSFWMLFRCKSCGFPTHALLSDDGGHAGSDDSSDAAVVVNFPVGPTGRIRNLKGYSFFRGLV